MSELSQERRSKLKTQIEAFSNEGGFIKLNKRMLHCFGPDKAVFIGNLIDNFKLFLVFNKLVDGEWFYLTHERQMEQTGIDNEKKIRRYKRAFRNRGIIRTKMMGAPAKEYYTIDLDILEECLEEVEIDVGYGFGSALPELVGLALPKTSGLALPGASGLINNKNIFNKNINNKKVSKDTSRRFRKNVKKTTMRSRVQEKAKRRRKTPVSKKTTKVSHETRVNKSLFTFWNKQPNLTTHKTGTKTYNSIMNRLNLMMKGKIHEKIDDRNFPENIPESLFKKKWTKFEIKEAIQNLNDWCKAGNYPVKKDWIKKLSFADAIYNQRSNSPLIQAFHQGVKPLYNPASNLNDVEKSVFNLFTDFFNSFKDTSNIKKEIALLSKDLFGHREKNELAWRSVNIMKALDLSKDDYALCTATDLAAEYISYLEGNYGDFEIRDNLNPKMLLIGKPIWNMFSHAYFQKYGHDVLTAND